MEKKLKDISKLMSFVLRHKPEEIGLQMNDEGWANVNELIQKMNAKNITVDFEIINSIVETNDKKRFTFNDDKTFIRASQGHSIDIDLALSPTEPPEYLYHGTGEKTLAIILKEGIQKMNRQHVHLSKDKITAINVGARHGKPIVLIISSGEMWRHGKLFYHSANGVWLTDFVDIKYISS